MALAKNIMSTGFTAMQALAIGGGVAEGLTATGTNQATAYPMKFGTQVFTTVASGTGCQIPPGAPGDEVWIANKGANTLKVYPPEDAAFNSGSVNASVDLIAGAACIFKCISAILWITVILSGTAGFGTVTSVAVSGGTTGLTTTGGPITAAGTITLTGTLGLGNGGTGATDAAGARTSLGLGTIATQNANNVTIIGGSIFGTTVSGYVTTTTTVNGKALSGNITLGLASADFVNQGTTTTVLHGNAAGNPSFTAVVEADITLADNTTNNVATTKHGFAPKLPNDATKYLDGTGAYTVPAGSGGSPSVTTIVAATSFPAANLVDITSIAATYRELYLVVAGASSDTASRQLQLLVSTDNGSTFATTNYMAQVEPSGGTSIGFGTAFSAAPAVQTAAETDAFVARITGYQGTGAAQCVTMGLQRAVYYTCFSTYIGSASAINALRLIWNSTGNFDAGTYKLLGVT